MAGRPACCQMGCTFFCYIGLKFIIILVYYLQGAVPSCVSYRRYRSTVPSCGTLPSTTPSLSATQTSSVSSRKKNRKKRYYARISRGRRDVTCLLNGGWCWGGRGRGVRYTPASPPTSPSSCVITSPPPAIFPSSPSTPTHSQRHKTGASSAGGHAHQSLAAGAMTP